MGERRRETKKERERRGSDTDVPKLYTYNDYEHYGYHVNFAGKYLKKINFRNDF